MTVTLVLNVQRLISHRLNTGRETQESPILDTKEKNNGSHRACVAPIPFVHEWKIYNVLLDIIIYSMKAVTVTRRLNHRTYKFAPTFLTKGLVFSKENFAVHFLKWIGLPNSYQQWSSYLKFFFTFSRNIFNRIWRTISYLDNSVYLAFILYFNAVSVLCR